jgi:hypothetical protein
MRLLGTVRLSHDVDESTSPARPREQIAGYSQLNAHQVVAITEDLDVSGAMSVFNRSQLGPWLAHGGEVTPGEGWTVGCGQRQHPNYFRTKFPNSPVDEFRGQLVGESARRR